MTGTVLIANLKGGCGKTVLATTLAAALAADLTQHQPQRVRLLKPGDWRVEQSIEQTCRDAGIELVVDDDPHFICSLADFEAWADGRKRFLLEDFYRWLRKRTWTGSKERSMPRPKSRGCASAIASSRTSWTS